MKTVLLRWFHVSMAVLVLLSSTGFGLVEHSCQMRGKRISSALTADPCPGCTPEQRVTQPQQTPTVKRADCCKTESRYANVDVGASLTQMVAKFLKSISEAILAVVISVVSWLVGLLLPEAAIHALSLPKGPPGLSGRSLLTFIQQFLI